MKLNFFMKKKAQDNDNDGAGMTLKVGKLGAYRRLVLLRGRNDTSSFSQPNPNGVQGTWDMDEGRGL